MSEYQYYDFRVIDKPLTASQRADISNLSSRANVTAQRAKFVYHYGDFRGDETNLSARLHQRLRNLSQATSESGVSPATSVRRTVMELQTAKKALELAARQQAEREAAAKRRETERLRQLYLDGLVGREAEIWQKVNTLVNEGNAKNYDQAAQYLADLHELAQRQGTLEIFTAKLETLINQYSRRTAFIRRLRSNNSF